MSISAVQKRFLSTAEAAEFAGVHPNTIRTWAAAGKIKARRTPGGRLWRFDINELEAALAGVEN